MPNPQAAWTKASSMGPTPYGSKRVLTEAENANPLNQLIKLVSPLADPFGLAEDSKFALAGIGGLPEGLNSGAIRELLKREGIPWMEEAAPAIRHGVGRAIGGLKSAMGVGEEAAGLGKQIVRSER